MGATAITDGTVTKTMKNCWSCTKCCELFYCESFYDKDKRAKCTGGSIHEFATGELKVVDTGAGDTGFRFCTTCACVYLASSATAGVCVGGSSHTKSSFEMTLKKVGKDAKPYYAWQLCKKCACLYLSGGTTNGSCAKGKNHEPASTDYYDCTKKVDPSENR